MTKRLVGGATLAMLLAFGMHQSVAAVPIAGCSIGGSLYQYFGSQAHELRADFHLTCTSGTCGLFNVEIDWDDGNWSSDTGYATYQNTFSNVYGSGGTYHVKFTADDDLGNTCALNWNPYVVQ